MVDTNTIVAGVGMFTLVVMALVALILFARGRLVSTGDVPWSQKSVSLPYRLTRLVCQRMAS